MREIVWHSPTVEERYWSYVDRRGPDECWPWTGALEYYGHGVLYVGNDTDGNGIRAKAHRLAYNYANDEPAPDHLKVRHRCDYPPCQNPRHLLLGTQSDNIHDMYERGRSRNVGRPGIQHHAVKLTEEQVLDIIARRQRGERVKDLATEFGVRHSQISRIATGKRWAYLSKEGTK